MRLDWLFMEFTCLLLGRIESFSRVQQNETVLFRVDIGMSKLCDFARKNGWFSKKEKKKLLPGLETELGSSRCVFIVVTIFFFLGGGEIFLPTISFVFFFALFLCFFVFSFLSAAFECGSDSCHGKGPPLLVSPRLDFSWRNVSIPSFFFLFFSFFFFVGTQSIEPDCHRRVLPNFKRWLLWFKKKYFTELR